MYFKDPKQLLDIFKALEENNMFLIQNCQETDSVLEELRAKRTQTEAAMEADIANLQSQIDSLNTLIAKETTRCKALEERASKNGSNDDQEIKLEELNTKVNEVYQKCIGSNEANIGTLQMLTKIEKKMEELFAEIAKLPSDYVLQAEKVEFAPIVNL